MRKNTFKTSGATKTLTGGIKGKTPRPKKNPRTQAMKGTGQGPALGGGGGGGKLAAPMK